VRVRAMIETTFLSRLKMMGVGLPVLRMEPWRPAHFGVFLIKGASSDSEQQHLRIGGIAKNSRAFAPRGFRATIA
jgi:hypothetical protein